MPEAESGGLMPTDFPAGPDALCAFRVPAGRWSAPRREPSRLRSRTPIRLGDLQKPIPGGAAHRVGFALPAGIPNAINAALGPPISRLAVSSSAARESGVPGRTSNSQSRDWRSRRSNDALWRFDHIFWTVESSTNQWETTTLVQQFKSKNTPRVRNSLSLRPQGVTRFPGSASTQNSGTIRATRPQGRGTPSDL